MTDLDLQRRFLAEEVASVASVRTKALVDALALIPRERFLPPGPWIVRGEGDGPTSQRKTGDDDPRHVYHCIAVAIDPNRQLFNGAPTAVAPLIDALELRSGNHVLHVGCGLGYYTALIAHIVGPTGRVLALDVDHTLTDIAKRNLSELPWAETLCVDGTETLNEGFDAILVHAGVTHPLDTWLDSLIDGGRLVLPITVSLPKMGPLGKGLAFQITKRTGGTFEALPLNLITIYTAIGIRDDTLDPVIGAALSTWPYIPISRLRRDRHDQQPTCWLHGKTFCLGT